jgi:WD repeat-containing protein 61
MFRARSEAVKAHQDAIWTIAWPTETRLISGSCDEALQVFNPCNQFAAPDARFENSDLSIVSVDASADGATAVTSSMDGVIRVFDLEAKQLTRSIQAGVSNTWTVAMRTATTHVATGTHGGNVVVWDTATGEQVREVSVGGKFVLCVAYSPDGALLAAGAQDGVITVVDADTGVVVQRLSGAHTLPVRSLSFTPDSRLLLAAAQDGVVSVHDARGGEQRAALTGHAAWV